MKKLVFMFVAFAAISFASCGGNKTSDNAADSDSVATVDSTDSVSSDSAATVDSTAATTADSTANA